MNLFTKNCQPPNFMIGGCGNTAYAIKLDLYVKPGAISCLNAYKTVDCVTNSVESAICDYLAPIDIIVLSVSISTIIILTSLVIFISIYVGRKKKK